MAVPRTVMFWQIVDPKTGDPLNGTFPARQMVQRIKGLPKGNRTFEARDGWRLQAQGIKQTSAQHIVLYRIRREGLPHLERGGNYSDLQLAEDQNLAEATHVRFFPRNVIGVLYNHDGPQVGRLTQYLAGHLDAAVSFAPVLRRDVAQSLDSMQELSQVYVAIPVNRAHLLKDDGTDTIRTLKEMVKASSSKTVYAKFTLWGSDDPKAGSKWLKVIKKIASTDMFAAFKQLKVKGYDFEAEKRVWVDLVAEQLTMSEQVELSSALGRAVKPSSAADAIQNAYDLMESEITSSVPPVKQSDPPLRLEDLSRNSS